MGIDVDGLRILLEAHERFGPLGETLQLGRQGLYVADTPEVDGWIRRSGVAASLAEATAGTHYGDERLLPLLGASKVTTVDASAYEGAGIVHDFNEPVPDALLGRFDTVIDYGSTEHIFNVAQSWRNLLQLPKVGGRLVACLPANNWFGHGFYQFSAELAFRVLVPENGYRLHAVYYGSLSLAPMTRVTDSGAEGVRGEIGVTNHLSSLLYIAERVAEVVPFTRRWPQQGDYAAAWREAAA